jgi:hypothetical protein
LIRKIYAALQNLVTSLPNPNPDPNPMLSGQVESESEKNRLGSASLSSGNIDEWIKKPNVAITIAE